MTTYPADADDQFDGSEYPPIVVEPTIKDDVTGARWMHKDLVEVAQAWAEEEHISPAKADEKFGDVESLAGYIARYSDVDRPLVTWSASGIHAVLDYHDWQNGQPGRCQWKASYPFVLTPEWRAWMGLASGQPIPHGRTIEFLEDHAEDIDQPNTLDLMTLLRQLRGIANSEVETTVRPDGTGSVASTVDRKVNVELPEEIRIAVQAIKGHTRTMDAASGPVEAPVKQELTVRVRVTVDNSARLAFRFSIPNAERQLEKVFVERVNQARALLPDYLILRAAD